MTLTREELNLLRKKIAQSDEVDEHDSELEVKEKQMRSNFHSLLNYLVEDRRLCEREFQTLSPNEQKLLFCMKTFNTLPGSLRRKVIIYGTVPLDE